MQMLWKYKGIVMNSEVIDPGGHLIFETSADMADILCFYTHSPILIEIIL